MSLHPLASSNLLVIGGAFYSLVAPEPYTPRFGHFPEPTTTVRLLDGTERTGVLVHKGDVPAELRESHPDNAERVIAPVVYFTPAPAPAPPADITWEPVLDWATRRPTGAICARLPGGEFATITPKGGKAELRITKSSTVLHQSRRGSMQAAREAAPSWGGPR